MSLREGGKVEEELAVSLWGHWCENKAELDV